MMSPQDILAEYLTVCQRNMLDPTAAPFRGNVPTSKQYVGYAVVVGLHPDMADKVL